MEAVPVGAGGWPASDEELIERQLVLGREARIATEAEPWAPEPRAIIGGCFVAYAAGEAGPGHPGDRAWAAAVAWRSGGSTDRRPVDRHLRGARGRPRRADDVVGQS